MKFYFCFKEKGKLWIDGIRKYKIPLWASKIPNRFKGWARIEDGEVNLFNEDWTVRKSYKVTRKS